MISEVRFWGPIRERGRWSWPSRGSVSAEVAEAVVVGFEEQGCC